jgi:hypothetical protein
MCIALLSASAGWNYDKAMYLYFTREKWELIVVDFTLFYEQASEETSIRVSV